MLQQQVNCFSSIFLNIVSKGFKVSDKFFRDVSHQLPGWTSGMWPKTVLWSRFPTAAGAPNPQHRCPIFSCQSHGEWPHWHLCHAAPSGRWTALEMALAQLRPTFTCLLRNTGVKSIYSQPSVYSSPPMGAPWCKFMTSYPAPGS